MGFLFGSMKTQGSQQPAMSGIQIQTSVYGKCIPLVYGCNRLAPNVIWYGDFVASAAPSQGGGKGGVVGGSGGKGGGGSAGYTYKASFELGLCEGPITGVGRVFIDKNVSTPALLGYTVFLGTYPQNPWTYLKSAHPTQALGYNGLAHMDVANLSLGNSANLPNHNMEVAGFFSTMGSQISAPAQPTVNTFSGSGQATTYYVAVTWVNKQGETTASTERTQTTTAAQRIKVLAPTSPPAGALGWNVYVSTTASGGSGQETLQNDTYIAIGTDWTEGAGGITTTGAALPTANTTGTGSDADPSLVLNDILTNATHGAGFPVSRVGDMTVYQEYVQATGLLISPVYTAQQSAATMVDDIAKNTNSAAVWSSGKLVFVPYGDVNITANGYTYTAPSAPIYDLTDDDFMPQTGEDPVVMTRKRQSDSINNLKMEYNDKSNNYNIGVVEVSDLTSIELYGIRQDASNNAHLFTNSSTAHTSAQLQLYRQSIRNIYKFTLDQRYILLDPMDIVSLTDSVLGLNKQWVRILTIEEQEDYSLVFTAEEYLQGLGSPATNTFQTGAGYTQDYNADPGYANTPVIFDCPPQISNSGGLETWMAVSGASSIWGGCNVYISSDDTTYEYVGRINGQSRQGVSTALFVAGNDPDTAHALSVDVSESSAQLLSGTQSDADLGHTLCYIDGELIAYQTATLTGSFQYQLGTYIRRGMYGTTIGTHAVNSKFARLDQQIFTLPYDKSKIGTTVYIKLAGFNVWGGGQKSLADVDPITHVLTGPPLPANVQNFNVKQNGNAVVFTWNDTSPYDVYDIGFATQGETDWSKYTLLTEAHRATEMTNANVPPGTWTFGIRAKNIADGLSPAITTHDFTVQNLNSVLTVQEQAPDYSGAVSGFIRHWSGVLIPDDQHTASFYAGSTNFMAFCPTPVSSCKYTTPTFDVCYNANLRIFETNNVVLGSGQTGSSNISPTTYLDSWQSSSSDPSVYNPWTIGSANFRYANMQLQYVPVAGSVGVVKEFGFTVDTVPVSETSPQTIAVSSGGTVWTFPSPFNTVPFVVPVVQSSAALYATVSGVTTTQATINIWSSSGGSVSGSVIATATGT